VRVIRFSSGAAWHIAEPTCSRTSSGRSACGRKTDLGQAFALLAEEMNKMPPEARMLPPQIVLISDGKPTMTGRAHCRPCSTSPGPARSTAGHCLSGRMPIRRRCEVRRHPEKPVLRVDNAEQLVGTSAMCPLR